MRNQTDKISIELDKNDAVFVLSIFDAFLKQFSGHIGEDPLLYSKLSRINNEIQEQLLGYLSDDLNDIINP